MDEIARFLGQMSLAGVSVNAVVPPLARDDRHEERDGRRDQRRAPSPDRRGDGRWEGGRGDYTRDRARDPSVDRLQRELDWLEEELSRRDWEDRVRGANSRDLPYPPRDRRAHYAPRGPPAYDDRRHYSHRVYQDSGGRGRPSRYDPRRENLIDLDEPAIEDHGADVFQKN